MEKKKEGLMARFLKRKREKAEAKRQAKASADAPSSPTPSSSTTSSPTPPVSSPLPSTPSKMAVTGETPVKKPIETPVEKSDEKSVAKSVEKSAENPAGKSGKKGSKSIPFKEMLAKLFQRKPRKAKDAGKESEDDLKKRLAREKAAETARAAEKTRQFLKRQRKKQKQQKRDIQYRRRMLGSLIVKAGFTIKPEMLQRRVLYASFVALLASTFFTLLTAVINGKSAVDLIIFLFGLWTGVFALIYFFFLMVVYIYLDLRIFRRTKELEEVLPDFLQLASANISAGMPIDRALWFAIRPNFGVLAREIEEVAKATLAGEELSESLTRFTERYDSVTLKRSISILLEGIAAGGEIADLLDKIALNIQETKILRKEMSANVTTYAIFITFASIVVAPVLFALATELLSIIVNITSVIDLGGSSNSFIRINLKTSASMVDDFKFFSYLMLSIGALMSGSIVSVIKKGRVKEGLSNIPIFIGTSLVIYLVAFSILHGLLGGLF